MTVKPNFFIVGAPKCGTTSLDYYLKQHPEIFVPDVKELHYFGSDLLAKKHPLANKFDEQTYLEFFKENKYAKIIGEASVMYLFSKKAAQEIHEFNNNAKIIIMLRNPIEMMYSLHSQNLSTCDEDIQDFGRALDAEKLRKKGELIPKKSLVIQDALLYKSVAKYSEQLERYTNIFTEKNIHIMLFDDFIKDTKNEVREVFKFLAVSDTEFKINLEIKNTNSMLRNRKLYYFINRPNSQVKKLVKKILPTQLRRLIASKVNSMNTIETKRGKMSEELLHHLNKEFANSINNLEQLIKKDLTKWKQK